MSRYPSLTNRITRAAHANNVQKIEYLKSKLGDRYSRIGRDKRVSPSTTKRSSTFEPQKPVQFKLKEFLMDRNNLDPIPIVPGDITSTLLQSRVKKGRRILRIQSNF